LEQEPRMTVCSLKKGTQFAVPSLLRAGIDFLQCGVGKLVEPLGLKGVTDRRHAVSPYLVPPVERLRKYLPFKD
jgi:hypothetical protein